MTLQMVAIAAHLFSAIIYLMILVYAASTLPHIKRAYNQQTRILLALLMLLIIGLSAAFITSLALWFIDIGSGQAATLTNVLWMMFNWLNAITVCVFIAMARMFLLWRPVPCHDAPIGCPRLNTLTN